MIGLQLEFLAGQFHANPWDRGTNEGVVDWPPSPWRLLRALVAAWHRAGAPEVDEFVSLLDQLAGPPVYHLPHAMAGHTRHYMPLGTSKDGRPETTLVLDSFITFERHDGLPAKAFAIWPEAAVSPDQRVLLERCCGFISYLGRAESWCSASVIDAPLEQPEQTVVDLVSRSNLGGTTVRRLAAGPSLRGRNLLTALSETTAEMRKARRLMPVGASWVEYSLPPDFLMVREQYERAERSKNVFGPILLRFAIDRGRHTPKPSIKEALVFAELFRAASIRRLSDKTGEPATYRLAGKAENGCKREGHDHPYFLPFDSEGRGEIDGVDVWFPKGCTHDEYVAVTSVLELREHVFYRDTFAVTFIGRVREESSSLWRSATPIVLDRFPKVRGTNGGRRVADSPEEQIRRMLDRLFLPPTEIELWEPGRGIERARAGRLRLDAFRCARLRKHSAPLPVVAATLRFPRAVRGPIVLGSLAHFGLGRFEPAEEPTRVDEEELDETK